MLTAADTLLGQCAARADQIGQRSSEHTGSPTMLWVTWFLVAGCALAAGWATVRYFVHESAVSPVGPSRAHLRGEGRSPVIIAVLLSAGALQASPILERSRGYLIPGLLVLLGLASFHALVTSGSSRRGVTVGPTALVATVLALGWWNVADTDYGSTKLLNLIITTAVSAAACVLLATEARRIRFLWSVVGVGFVTLLLSLRSPSVDVAVGRVAAEGATTIATGRMAGAAIVVLIAWMAANRARRPSVGIVVVLALAALMAETGSRGPLVAAGMACTVVMLVAFIQRPGRAVILTALALVLARIAWSQASAVSQERIRSLVSDNPGRSVTQREFMWSRSWEIAASSWRGRGWGNLNASDLIVDKYPHNLFLEVAVEAGWLAVAGIVILGVVGASRAFRARRCDASALPLLGLLVFVTVNAMVSGDVTDNRILFVIAAACWALPQREAASGSKGRRNLVHGPRSGLAHSPRRNRGDRVTDLHDGRGVGAAADGSHGHLEHTIP